MFPLPRFPPPTKEFFLPEIKVGRPERYRWTIPNRDKARIDSDVVYDEGRRGMTDCFAADSNGIKVNAGFVRSETLTPTPGPTPEKVAVEEESPQFCADVISVDNFDFMGCALPCRKREDCPDGTFCAYTDDCGPG